MKKHYFLAVALLIVTMSVGGQALLAVGDSGSKSASQDHEKVKVVNSTCPITGGEIDSNNVPEELTRVFHDQTVGFCCSGCPENWDKLSESQKEQKLESSTKKM